MDAQPAQSVRSTVPHQARRWHPEDIRAAVRKRYGSLKALSRRLGLNPGAVSACIRRPDAYAGVEMRIAELIDVPRHELWPDRWGPDGERLPRTGHRKPAPDRAPHHSQKCEAA